MDATVRNLDGDDADTVELRRSSDHVPPGLDRPSRALPRRQTETGLRCRRVRRPSERRPDRSVAAAGWPTFTTGGARTHAFPRPSRDARRTRRKPKDQSESINTKKETGRPQRDRCDDRRLPNSSPSAVTKFDENVETPVVVDDEFRDLHKTQEVVDFLGQQASRTTSNAPTKSQRPLRSGKARGRNYKDADIDPLRHIQRDRPVASDPEPRRCRRDDGRRGQRGGSRTRRTARTHRLDRESALEEVADR